MTSLKHLFRDRSEIALAYLFGSRAQGKAHPASDTDIAVLLDEKNDIRNTLDYRLGLLQDVKNALQTENIDLVILNNATPLLRSQVVRYGKVLYSVNAAIPIRFKARAIVEYLDVKPMLDFFTAAAVRRIKEA